MAGRKMRFRLFSDDGKYLDRFGLVFALAAASVTILSLIDLDNPTATLRSQIGWAIVTFIVGATLVAVVRTTGVARLPRIFVEVAVGLAFLGVAILTMSSLLFDAETLDGAGQYSILWAVVAMASPVLVLRRVMMQRVVTKETLSGAIAVYLLLALAFNYAFLAINGGPGATAFFGNAESTSSFMYFSLSTITTVGYGDLAAVDDVGRFLSSAEAVIGQVLLVTIVARLVSMYRGSTEPITAPEEHSSSATVE